MSGVGKLFTWLSIGWLICMAASLIVKYVDTESQHPLDGPVSHAKPCKCHSGTITLGDSARDFPRSEKES